MHPLLRDLPTRLETARLTLRPYQAGDGPAYYAVCRTNRAHLLPYEAGNPALEVATVEDAEVLVRRFAAQWAAREAFFFGAWARATGRFEAQIYVGVVSWELPEFEIGYFADQAHEGQGFVSEAARAALRFAFVHLEAHRVSLRCNATNTRSVRVAERCGFTREGRLRQANPHLRLPGGMYSDELLYAMLREEFARALGEPG
jgi:RimJ/RimL family protein N-acetyltransferase